MHGITAPNYTYQVTPKPHTPLPKGVRLEPTDGPEDPSLLRQGHENAIRAKNGETIEEHRAVVGKILSKMSDVAAVRAPASPVHPCFFSLSQASFSRRFGRFGGDFKLFALFL